MNEEFKVNYWVNDGLFKWDRQQHFMINKDDINHDMDDMKLLSLFYELMNEDFLNKISPFSYDEDKFIAWAKEVIKEGCGDE